MATCNFWTMEEFPLYVMSNYEVCVSMLGDEDEEGNKIEEYSIDDLQIAYDFLNENIEYALEELNDKLEWYKVTFKDGYYDGVQFYIDTDYISINDKRDPWTEEDAQYEFDLSLNELKSMIEKEKEMILEFLENSKDFGFRELLCGGVFSNGEAIYYYKDELEKRAKLAQG